MTSVLPAEVVRLLDASGPEAREAAWTSFLGAYNPVLVRAARSLGPQYDGVMDRYAYVLEELRREGFRRLRGCAAAPPTDFGLWLTVVARRLSLDHYRSRYGRLRKSASLDPPARHSTRRRVEDLLSEGDPELLADERAPGPDDAITRDEARQALRAALSELDTRDRLLLRFRFDEGCSASEIARLMSFPTVFHVYRRITAILAVLRQSLESRGFGGD